MANEEYPLFVGLRYNWTVPQTQNLLIKLTYTNPGGNIQMVTDDAFVGLSGDTDYSSSSENSDSDSEDGVNNSLSLIGSNKTNYDAVMGVFAGIIVVIVIVAIALWVVVKKMNKKRRNFR